MSKIYISSIAAMAANRVIGRDNDMPWHIPADFKYFKKTTMGKPLVMGRKCYESLGKPLPARPNIVISRAFQEPLGEDGPFYCKTIEDALTLARAKAESLQADEIFIAGGGEIYKQTLPITERLYLTVIHKDYEGDVFFPAFDWNDWKIMSEKRCEAENTTPAFTFFVLERK